MTWNPDYKKITGLWKSVKDTAMLAVAAVIAVVGINALGIAQQCPDATLTIAGTTVTLKFILQFVNNYRKHN